MSTRHGAVVVVSPDDENRTVLRSLFQEFGWSIREKRAVAAFRDSLKPLWSGVVLTECELPDGTWRDILACAAATCPRARVIVMSRVADEALWVEILNDGAFDLLAKPLNRAELARTVNSAWRESQVRVATAVA